MREICIDIIYFMTSDGKTTYRYENPDLRWLRRMFLDEADNVIVCGGEPNNSENCGKETWNFSSSKDVVKNPRSAAQRHADDTMILGCLNDTLLFVNFRN